MMNEDQPMDSLDTLSTPASMAATNIDHEMPSAENIPTMEDSTMSSPSTSSPRTGLQGGVEGSVAQELGELGKRLVATLRAAWESPERRQLERELNTGLETLSRELEKGVDQLRGGLRGSGSEIRQQVEKTTDQARSSNVLDEIRTGLVQGLREVNASLDKTIQSLEQRQGAQPGSTTTTGATPHKVPIEMGADESVTMNEPSSTGGEETKTY